MIRPRRIITELIIALDNRLKRIQDVPGLEARRAMLYEVTRAAQEAESHIPDSQNAIEVFNSECRPSSGPRDCTSLYCLSHKSTHVQRAMMYHLIGAHAFRHEALETVEALASAHGWEIKVIPHPVDK